MIPCIGSTAPVDYGRDYPTINHTGKSITARPAHLPHSLDPTPPQQLTTNNSPSLLNGAPTAEIYGDSFSGIPADSRCSAMAQSLFLRPPFDPTSVKHLLPSLFVFIRVHLWFKSLPHLRQSAKICGQAFSFYPSALPHIPSPYGAPTAEIFGDSFPGIPAD